MLREPWQYGRHAAVRIPRTAARPSPRTKGRAHLGCKGAPARDVVGGCCRRFVSPCRSCSSRCSWTARSHPRLRISFDDCGLPPRCECFSPTRVHSSRVRLAGRFKVFQPRRSRRACCVLRVGSSSLSSHLSVVLDFLCVSLANSLADWTGSTRRKGLVLPRTFESQWDASHRFPSVPPRKGSLGYPLASRSVPKLALTLQRVKSLISSLRRLVGFLTVDGQPNKKFGVKKKAV